jgi:type IV pilus assembly protein PilA
MALVTCPDCGTQVSDQAPACPRCARPLQGMQQQGMQQGMQPAWQQRPQAPKSGMGVGLIIAIVAAVLIVPTVGIVAVMGIYGTRKYIANAKTAEAKNVLGQLSKDAMIAYEGESPDEPGKRRVCPSASAPVPADRNAVSGKKYQSSASDWQTDLSANKGFACLKFEMNSPQYYQYEYEATATGFVARAHGDLNGDGVFSTFEIKGQVIGDRLVISPVIEETNPEE